MTIIFEIPSVLLFNDPKSLRRTMRQVGAEGSAAVKSLIRQATREAGKKPVEEAGAPPISRTGALLSSITSAVSRDGESVTIKAGVYYSKFLEHGAIGGGGRKGSRNKRGIPQTSRIMQPHPFFDPPIARLENGWRERIIKSVVEDISLRKIK